MNLFRRCIAATILAFGFSAPALAVTASPDFSDLWYLPTESGWGINLSMQGTTMFAALYVYGNDGAPRWYVATNMAAQPAGSGQFKFGGELFATTGTYFGTVPYVNATNPQLVGTMAVTFTSATSGTLVYNVGSVNVTKNIERIRLADNNLTGVYLGGIAATQNGCTNSANNGLAAYFTSGNIAVTQTGSAVAIRMDTVSGAAITCNFTGTYTQEGRLGKITGGLWSCVSSTAVISNGTFGMTEVDVQTNALSATFTGGDNFCSSYVGRFGGLRIIGG
jgi:hypothetical protein